MIISCWYITNATRINRNIVECKFRAILKYTDKILELIETLWNVNTPSTDSHQVRICELIETLWNVNNII